MAPGQVFALLIITIGFTLYFFFKARHAERMAMIEKGTLHLPQGGGRKFKWIPNFLGVKLGMLLFGMGMGMLTAYFICMVTEDQTIYPAMILLFGGGSLVASFFIERKLAEGHEDKEYEDI